MWTHPFLQMRTVSVRSLSASQGEATNLPHAPARPDLEDRSRGHQGKSALQNVGCRSPTWCHFSSGPGLCFCICFPLHLPEHQQALFWSFRPSYLPTLLPPWWCAVPPAVCCPHIPGQVAGWLCRPPMGQVPTGNRPRPCQTARTPRCPYTCSTRLGLA